MNIMQKLTLRHLKENKRRTIVTIVGVIISVAMIMAVSTLIVSFMDMMQRQTIAEKGEWHAKYPGVNQDQLISLKKEEHIKDIFLSKDVGYAELKDTPDYGKPYLFVTALDTLGFKKIPLDLTAGRLPKAENEVVLSEPLLDELELDYKIGDKLQLDVGTRYLKDIPKAERTPLDQFYGYELEEDGGEFLADKKKRTYTIVGFMKRPNWEQAWSPGYTLVTYLDEKQVGEEAVDASIILNKLKFSSYDDVKAIGQKIGIEEYGVNDDLFRYAGIFRDPGFATAIISMTSIVMIIIMIGSVSLIYNAFAISVSERARHLGMLASIGATSKQKRQSVFFEGAVIGLISIPLGILSGVLGMTITFSFINHLLKEIMVTKELLEVVVTPYSVILSILIAIITIFISVYIPARRAAKVSAIDAIRQSDDIKLTKKAVKTSAFVRKLFGLEAEIGLKNLKRNRRRYRATVFSLVISIVLFLSVSYFTTTMAETISLKEDKLNHDIEINLTGDQFDEQKAKIDSIRQMEEVTDMNLYKILYMNAKLKPSMLPKEFQEDAINGDDSLNTYIYGMPTNDLKKYADKVGVDYKKLANLDSFQGIVINKAKYEHPKTYKLKRINAIEAKVGDQIPLAYFDYIEETDEEKERPIGDLQIASLTEELPTGINEPYARELIIIVSEDVLLNRLKDAQYNQELEASIFLKSDKPLETDHEIKKMGLKQNYFMNQYRERMLVERMFTAVTVFIYGFIVLITLISVANIFNTISTSISLRKREFAMLRSVGMTPKGFNKMINYESIFYGMKALLYGIPLSIGSMLCMYWRLRGEMDSVFKLPWIHISVVIVAVFIIVTAAMLYSSSKVKKENIINALKQENI